MTTTTGQRGGNGRALEMRPSIPMPGRVGQATAVEQSRAVAEVHAAIVVAQQVPRREPDSIAAMEEACRQRELADRAFFSYPRGGETVSGASVHLARELARCWGNIQYGISELRRDDDAGQSEMQAWAWDVQTNARSSNTFIVPHARDTKKGRQVLTDMRDVYENNANMGARRLREAIFSVLPTWYTERAKAACWKTQEDGGGAPIAQRVADAIRNFGKLGISQARLEAKTGSPAGEWTPHDVARLGVSYTSLRQGTVTAAEEFPEAAERVTAEEITGQLQQEEGPADPPRARAGKTLTAKLDGLLRRIPLGTQEDTAALLEWQCGGPYRATRGQAQTVVGFLEDHLQAAQGDTQATAENIWAQYRAATAQDASEGTQEVQGD